MLAYTYPLLDLFWSILVIFGFLIWIWLLITVFVDIFRSPDMSGVAKAFWFLFVLIIPLMGVLFYLILRGHKMQEHAAQAAQQQERAFRRYVQEASGNGGSSADQLAKLADLRQRGVISPEEFEREKARILS